MYAHVATGRWASLVPHPWGQSFRLPADVRVMTILGAAARSMVGLVTPSEEPVSVLARAFVEVAKRLKLDELFAHGPLIVED
jgi:hypothetical protein